MWKTGPPEKRLAVKTCFAKIAEQDLMQLRCVEQYHNTPQVTFYAYTVAVPATFLANVVTNPTTIEKNRGLHRETLGNQDPEWTTIG